MLYWLIFCSLVWCLYMVLCFFKQLIFKLYVVLVFLGLDWEIYLYFIFFLGSIVVCKVEDLLSQGLGIEEQQENEKKKVVGKV